LSLKNLASVDGLSITIDTTKECAILAEFQNTLIKLHECDDGLYYFDLSSLLDIIYDASSKERGNNGADDPDSVGRNEKDSDVMVMTTNQY